MSIQALAADELELTIGDPALGGPVLERLVSAAAAKAGLPVDRLINAMTLTDSLVHAISTALAGRAWHLKLAIAPQSLLLAVADLTHDEAAAIREAALLPDVGDVLAHTAASVSVDTDDDGSVLVIALD